MKALLFVICCIYMACSNDSSPTVGGTFIPNRIRGRVITNNGTQKNGTSYLKKVEIRDNQTYSTTVDSCELDTYGFYEFSGFDDAYYVLETKNSSQSLLLDQLNFFDHDTIYPLYMIWQNPSTLVGRALNYSGSKIFIPGTTISAEMNSDGIYQLNNAPQGNYSLAFANGSLTHFLPISITSEKDTLYIADIDINNSQEYSKIAYETTTQSRFLEPVIYQDSVPEWYEGKSFDDVGYKTIDGEPLTIIVRDSIIKTVVDTLIVRDTIFKLPVEKKILFLTDEASYSIDDYYKELITLTGNEYVHLFDKEVTVADTANIKALFISDQVNVGNFDPAFLELIKQGRFPIYCMDRETSVYLNMCASTKTDTWMTSVLVIDSLHSITNGYWKDTPLFNGITKIDYATVSSPDAKILAVHGDSLYPILFSYDVGDQLSDTTATTTKRRVGFNLLITDPYTLTINASKLIMRSIMWILEE